MRSNVCLATFGLICSIVLRAHAGNVQELTNAFQQGVAQFNAGKFDAATPHFEQAVRLASSVYGRGDIGKVHKNTAKLMKFLADCYLETYRIGEARPLYDQAFDAMLREEGRSSQDAYKCKDSLGLLFRRIGQLDRAEIAYREAFSGLRDPAQRAQTAKKLGYLYMNQDRHELAIQHFSMAIEPFVHRHDRDSILHVSDCRHGLGMVSHRRGEFQAAIARFESGLQQRQSHLPANHYTIAHSKGMLAACYAAIGRDDLARPLFEQASKIMLAFWGTANHIDVAMEQHELALLLSRETDINNAVRMFDSSRRTYRQYQLQALSGLASEEQLQFLRHEQGRFMDAVAFASRNAKSESVPQHAFEWILNQKGMANQTLAQRELLARQAANSPQLAKVAVMLQEVREKLAALAVDVGNTDKKNLQQQLAKNEVQLSLALSTKANPDSMWVETQQIVNQLPPNTSLIELVRLDRKEPAVSSLAPFEKDESAAQYVAWILSSNGSMNHVNLGSASEIERDLQSMRQTMDEASQTLQFDPEAATTQANETLRVLSKKILWPILPHLEQTSNWIISPDSELWLVPWAALLMPNDRYVIQDKTISYVVSGRDLITHRAQRALPAYGYILSDPDFDMPAERRLTASHQRPSGSVPEPLRRRGDEPLSISTARDWPPLNGTATEAREIQQPVTDFVKGSVFMLNRRDAMETHVKQTLRRPRVAVIATHGFFLVADDEQPTNPLLRCGLILAGANQRNPDGSGDDGILTGMEVLQIDMRGTEVVVLSACDTGIGRITSGEGVSGLRQAFHLAGASTVVSTLWKTPDSATADLMKEFWLAMSTQDNPNISMAIAQRRRIQQCEQEYGASHPWLWASPAITNIGQSKEAQ